MLAHSQRHVERQISTNRSLFHNLDPNPCLGQIPYLNRHRDRNRGHDQNPRQNALLNRLSGDCITQVRDRS